MTKKQKKMLYRILAAAVLFLAAKLIPLPALVSAALYFAAYLTVGCDILRKAWKGICNRQVFDENFLMAVATVGAIALALYERSGDYSEAVAVMLFYQIGELFQSYAVGKSRRSITALMDIRPDYANIERDGKLEQVDPDDVAVGTVITVQPGEKVPIDGVVEDGISTLNTAALTGESLPRDVSAGDEIISGCINMTGVLKVRTTKAFGESTVSKILELMENSSGHKSRSESFISRFAKVYTPAVCYSALALAILPPLALTVSGADADWGTWVYRALTFLVISCPCALVISIPLSFFAGLGGAGKEGVLIKGSNYLEALSRTKTVVFDKTGTLTQGVFEVSAVHHSPMAQEKLLEYAALAECASSHPISKSLQKAAGGALDRSRVTDIQEHSGRGVTAVVDGVTVAAGNGKLMEELGVFTIGSREKDTGSNAPDYYNLINRGYRWYIDECKAKIAAQTETDIEALNRKNNWESFIIVMEALIDHAHRYADLAEKMAAECDNEERRQELRTMAENCRVVPEFAPKTFHQGVQLVWFTHLAFMLEGNGHNHCLGRFDQYMYPLYQADLARGVSEDFMSDLVNELKLKVSELKIYRPAMEAQSYAGCPLWMHMFLGGQLQNGKDACNGLTDLVLRSIIEMPTKEPAMSFRYHNNINRNTLRLALECIRKGNSHPAFFNDNICIPNLLSMGYSVKEAREYCVCGCVENMVPGITDENANVGFFNPYKILEITLNNGVDPVSKKQIGLQTGDVRTFTSMDQLTGAFRTQLHYFAQAWLKVFSRVVSCHAYLLPTLTASCFTQGCIDKGK